jgi:hypothetical protein
VPPGAQGAGGPQGALPVYGATSLGSKIFNPDIAVIGNFLGAAGRNTVRPSPSFEMREAEASFQAVVDPYARADFFMAFGEEGVDLEEGYVSFHATGWLARAPADAGGIRQGERVPHILTMARSSARHREPARRRGRAE